MTDKAYIVANEQQERDVLEKLEEEGIVWINGREATEWEPQFIPQYPYTLINGGEISWKFLSQLKDEEIVYDGRKEEKMSEKYVVSQEFMNELNEWRCVEGFFVGTIEISTLPDVVNHWWCNGNNKENNNRLIAIIRWVNGEDVFEVEKPKKWVVRSNELTNDDERYYVSIGKFMGLERALNTFDLEFATRFDTKEEAESWANAHQEVIEVVDV